MTPITAHRLARTTLTLWLLSLLAACLSPQAVMINPRFADGDIKLQAIGNDLPIQVSASDNRGKKAFGTRGGIYGKTSEIRPANDVAAALDGEARRLLTELAFAPHLANAETPVTFHVSLEELDYTVPGALWVTQVDIHCRIKVTATSGSRKLVTDYASESTYKLPMAPSATHNETYLNEVLRDTLKLAFTDLKLITFISK